MTLTGFFGLLGALLVLAFVANWQFKRTRIPNVVVLMAVGLLIGPAFELVEPGQFRQVTRAFGTLALILIMFEGGLELQLRDTLRHFPGGLLLAGLTYAVSFGLIGAVVWWSQALSLMSTLLVAAVLACTSSAIVLPVLQQMKVREKLRVTLLLESSLADVFAVLAVKVFLDTSRQQDDSILGALVGGVLAKILISLLLAVLMGVLWSRLLRVLSEQRFWNVLTFAVVLLLYALAEAADASGLIAVLGFGLTLSNFPGIDRGMVQAAVSSGPPTQEYHLQVLSFHSELAFLVRTFFFVLLGVEVEFGGLRGNLTPMIGVLGAIVLGRWLAVRASRWAWGEMTSNERELIFWIMPRGLVTAVLAIQVFESRGIEFAFLPGLAFATILVTNLLMVAGTLRSGEPATTEAVVARSLFGPGGEPFTTTSEKRESESSGS